jgi:YHS domain-containing protein
MHSLHSLVLASALVLAACGGGGGNAAPATSPSAPAASESAAPAASTAAPAAASDLKKPGEAKIGDKTTCPVSGEEFVVAADSPKAEYEGKTYYFCCPPCSKRFSADPKKYLH